ncbi:MAG: PAS domain-containing protein [Candidatus Taylorbacteria bacterium]|nr:PAS domain-containing protein [Candidatus Taylorbacteria bacterium]
MLQSIGDGIIATDSNRKVIVMNRVAEKLLCWRIDEAIGKLYDDIVLLHRTKAPCSAWGWRRPSRRLVI